MLKRIGSIAVLAAAVSLAVVAAAVARPTHAATASAAGACKKGVTIGMMAPITGPAASIGGDQLHWALFYTSQWNKVKGHVRINIKQADDQLDPSMASTLAQSFASR
jgi:ABC-type branched-subunit amino acid transport system substrate-binding protein